MDLDALCHKIKTYKDTHDGPFFCIVDTKYQTRSFAVDIRIGEVIDTCIRTTWDLYRQDKGADAAPRIFLKEAVGGVVSAYLLAGGSLDDGTIEYIVSLLDAASTEASSTTAEHIQ